MTTPEAAEVRKRTELSWRRRLDRLATPACRALPWVTADGSRVSNGVGLIHLAFSRPQ